MTLLQERTVLACLHVGVWSGMMRDQDVNEQVAEANKADVDNAGKYSKFLVTYKEMKGVHRSGKYPVTHSQTPDTALGGWWGQDTINQNLFCLHFTDAYG